MEYVIGYFAVVLFMFAWFAGAPIISFDTYDRRHIRWVSSFALICFSAFFWPILIIKNPKMLIRPSDLYDWDATGAMLARERARVKNELARCTNRVRYEAKINGQLSGEFEFPSEAMGTYIASRTKMTGYGDIKDLPEINSWVANADLRNGQASDVPWVWSSFNLLAEELIAVGTGSCFCGTCRTHYENWELDSGTGDGSPGWIAVIVKCPKGHEVLKFDLMKPFCGSHKHAVTSDEHDQHTHQEIPSFLRKDESQTKQGAC